MSLWRAIEWQRLRANAEAMLSPQQRARIARAKAERLLTRAKEPWKDQPRVPAGSSEGGQFGSGGGGTAPTAAEKPEAKPSGGGAEAVDYSNLRTMPKSIEGFPIIKKPLGGAMLALGGSGGIAVSTSKKRRQSGKICHRIRKKHSM